MNIQGFCSNFVEYASFLESNSPNILVLCDRNLDNSIDSSNFSVRGYLLTIQKDCITHIHSLAVYVKEGLPFYGTYLLKHCRFLLMFWTGFTSLIVLLLFPQLTTFFVFMSIFLFYFISHR